MCVKMTYSLKGPGVGSNETTRPWLDLLPPKKQISRPEGMETLASLKAAEIRHLCKDLFPFYIWWLRG